MSGLIEKIEFKRNGETVAEFWVENNRPHFYESIVRYDDSPELFVSEFSNHSDAIRNLYLEALAYAGARLEERLEMRAINTRLPRQ